MPASTAGEAVAPDAPSEATDEQAEDKPATDEQSEDKPATDEQSEDKPATDA